MDHTCEENGNNVLNIEEEADVTPVHSTDATNEISMNDDENYMHKYYAPFYHQRILKMYILNQNMIKQNEAFFVIKTLFRMY